MSKGSEQGAFLLKGWWMVMVDSQTFEARVVFAHGQQISVLFQIARASI